MVGVCLVLCAAGAGFTHYRSWQWSDPLRLWEDTVRKSPTNTRAWMNAGLAYMNRGDNVKARQYFERARQLSPSYSYVYMNLSALETREGRLEEALAQAQTAVRIEPRLSLTHYYLGQALERLGRKEEAAAAYRRAIDADPGDTASRAALAELGAAGRPSEGALMKAGLDALYARRDPAVAAALFRQVLTQEPRALRRHLPDSPRRWTGRASPPRRGRSGRRCCGWPRRPRMGQPRTQLGRGWPSASEQPDRRGRRAKSAVAAELGLWPSLSRSSLGCRSRGFNPGERVMGSTPPGHVLLAALGYRLVGLCIAAGVAWSHRFVALETNLVAGFVMAAIALAVHSRWIAAAACAIAGLIRPDAYIIGLPLGLLCVAESAGRVREAGGGGRRHLRVVVRVRRVVVREPGAAVSRGESVDHPATRLCAMDVRPPRDESACVAGIVSRSRGCAQFRRGGRVGLGVVGAYLLFARRDRRLWVVAG